MIYEIKKYYLFGKNKASLKYKYLGIMLYRLSEATTTKNRAGLAKSPADWGCRLERVLNEWGMHLSCCR